MIISAVSTIPAFAPIERVPSFDELKALIEVLVVLLLAYGEEDVVNVAVDIIDDMAKQVGGGEVPD